MERQKNRKEGNSRTPGPKAIEVALVIRWSGAIWNMNETGRTRELGTNMRTSGRTDGHDEHNMFFISVHANFQGCAKIHPSKSIERVRFYAPCIYTHKKCIKCRSYSPTQLSECLLFNLPTDQIQTWWNGSLNRRPDIFNTTSKYSSPPN